MTLEAGQAQRGDARASRARDLEKITAAVERELAMLKEARPALEARIDRAAGILVMQLSGGPRMRPIRVRTRGERVRFLVASLSSGGVTYEVDPKGWTCSCPDAHRHGRGCKHAISSYVLWKAAKPRRARCAGCGESFHPGRLVEVGEGQAEETLNPGDLVCRLCAPRHAIPVPRQMGCDACEGGWRRFIEEVVDEETGELVEATNTVRCRYCRERPPEPTLTDEEMLEWMATAPWREAKTYRGSGHEHEYTLRRQQDPDYFDRAARTVWWMGFDRHYLRRPWRTIDLDGYILWVYTKPQGPRDPYPEDTLLVNRAPSSIRKAGL